MALLATYLTGDALVHLVVAFERFEDQRQLVLHERFLSHLLERWGGNASW